MNATVEEICSTARLVNHATGVVVNEDGSITSATRYDSGRVAREVIDLTEYGVPNSKRLWNNAIARGWMEDPRVLKLRCFALSTLAESNREAAIMREGPTAYYKRHGWL